MFCSKCQERVKPVVIFDIDGSLGDYHGHFLGFAEMWMDTGRKALRHPFPGYDGSEKFSTWFCRVYGSDITTFREIKLAYRQGAQKRSMPLYTNMQRVAQAAAGVAEVWIATTRPYLSLSGIDSDTRFWLDKHKIPYDYLLYDEDKYDVIADRVDPERVCFVLDDEVSNLVAAAKYWKVQSLVLRRTRYNTGVSAWSGPVAASAADALPLLANRLQDWRRRNG